MNYQNPDYTSNQSPEKHWQDYPSWWNIFTSPLRPSSEDLDFLVAELLPKLNIVPSDPKRVVLLGVTPEIATLPWSENTEILAIDSSQAMIDAIWPARQVSRGKTICGDWRQIPLPDNSSDLVLGDGCFSALDYPQGYYKVLQEVYRVLKPNGLLAMRFFLRSSQAEDVKAVFEQLRTQSIGNFHAFKWRLAGALQPSLEEGIPVAEIWKTWAQEFPEPEKLLQDLGWSTDVLSTIDHYKHSSAIYTFPNLTEVKQVFDTKFIEESQCFPSYELGERCPTLIFRSRKQLET